MLAASRDAWDLLENTNNNFPERLAVVGLCGQAETVQYTYRELHASSCRLANFLAASGVCRGDRVAVCLPNSRQVLEAHYACAALHAVLVNINTGLVARELCHVLFVAGPKCVIAHRRQGTPLLEAITQLEQAATGQVSAEVLTRHLASSGAATSRLHSLTNDSGNS